jgi:hypothetical protein
MVRVQQHGGGSWRPGPVPDHRGLASFHGEDLDTLKTNIAQQLRYGIGTSAHVRSRSRICRYRRDAHELFEVATDPRQDAPHGRCEPLSAVARIHARHATERRPPLTSGLISAGPRLPFRT